MRNSQSATREEIEVQKLASQAGVTIAPYELGGFAALWKAGFAAGTVSERTSAQDALMDRLVPDWRETEIKVREDFTRTFDRRYAAFNGGEPITRMDDSGYTLVTSMSNDAGIWKHLLASAPEHLTAMDKLRYKLLKQLPRWAVPTRKGARPGVPVSGTWPKT